MTAKEMFERLGYNQNTNDDDFIEYISVNDGYGDFIYIIFHLTLKEYEVGYSNIYQTDTDKVVFVTTRVHKAITQQMKELEWI